MLLHSEIGNGKSRAGKNHAKGLADTQYIKACGLNGGRRDEVKVKFIGAGDARIIQAHDEIARLQYARGLTRSEYSGYQHPDAAQGTLRIC